LILINLKIDLWTKYIYIYIKTNKLKNRLLKKNIKKKNW